jgi:hypothetical protein
VVKREKWLSAIEAVFETVKAIADAAIPDVAADLDAQAADQLGVDFEFCGDIRPILRAERFEQLVASSSGVALSIRAWCFSTRGELDVGTP